MPVLIQSSTTTTREVTRHGAQSWLSNSSATRLM